MVAEGFRYRKSIFTLNRYLSRRVRMMCFPNPQVWPAISKECQNYLSSAGSCCKLPKICCSVVPLILLKIQLDLGGRYEIPWIHPQPSNNSTYVYRDSRLKMQ